MVKLSDTKTIETTIIFNKAVDKESFLALCDSLKNYAIFRNSEGNKDNTKIHLTSEYVQKAEGKYETARGNNTLEAHQKTADHWIGMAVYGIERFYGRTKDEATGNRKVKRLPDYEISDNLLENV